ncbi:(2Fe-2S)-binding protein [Leekyejoonella antrihumi]|uniref:(2Fe-2S)-binding protein n=1 Tax=Leekyejoonella antrihumi TaxID=1660198 RepID=A0A563E3J6_9MICO|nr:(2Fe-2S)-binding protein [Leekyejoonella antrihumi]
MVERAAALDKIAPLLRRVTAPFARPPLDRILLGETIGHAVHPLLTDLPIGFWTSAVTLDLCGGPSARPAATRLLGLGLLTAGPTAWTGWAEWHQLARPESRVGTAHALLNGAAVALFAGSWIARHRGLHQTGVAYGMAGSCAASAAGYLGGHLTGARKVGSRDAAYEQDGVGPLVARPSVR